MNIGRNYSRFNHIYDSGFNFGLKLGFLCGLFISVIALLINVIFIK